MWFFAFVPIGSVSKRIDGRARSPFSQGFGGSIAAHAPVAMTAHATSDTSMIREQRTNAGLELVLALVVKAFLDRDDLSTAIDQVGARHAFHVVGGRRLPLRVVDDREPRGCVAQETLGILPTLVDVDADDRQPFVDVARLHRVHPGKRAAAGSAPRCPEIDIDDTSAKRIERDALAARRRQREGWRNVARCPPVCGDGNECNDQEGGETAHGTLATASGKQRASARYSLLVEPLQQRRELPGIVDAPDSLDQRRGRL